MSSEEYLTIKEIARRLEVPESNIRYYRDRFQEFLPTVGQGRKKRYKSQALEVFRFIVKAYQKDQSTDQISHLLQQSFPRHLLPAQEEQEWGDQEKLLEQKDSGFHASKQDLLQSQATTLERLSQVLLQKNTLDSDVQKLFQEQQKLKKGLILVWKNCKQQNDYAKKKESQENFEFVQEKVEGLEKELADLRQKQEDMQAWVKGELQSIQEQLQKSQFWTKRLLLQVKQGTDTSSQDS